MVLWPSLMDNFSSDPTFIQRGVTILIRSGRTGSSGFFGEVSRAVWSVNPSLYVPSRSWVHGLRRYWPGSSYVDFVGSTMINFGGRKDYTVVRFARRVRTLHRIYRKPLMITEANTQYANRVQWLRNLRLMLRQRPWITSVAWSQLPSRGKAHLADTGYLDWNVQEDPAAAAVVRSIIQDGAG